MPKELSLKYLALENATALSVSKQKVSQPEIPLIYLSKSLLIGLVKTLFEGLKTFKFFKYFALESVFCAVPACI